MSFLYVTTYETYTVLKQSSDYSGIICPECVDLQTGGLSSTTWLFSNAVLSYRNLAVYDVNDWGVCVSVFVLVGVCWWLIWWVILPIWLIQCYRSEIAESPVFSFVSNSLPVIFWSNLSLSSCVEPLFHFKEPLPIYCLQIFYGCTVTQLHYWGKRIKTAALLWPLTSGKCLILTLTNSPQGHDADFFWSFVSRWTYISTSSFKLSQKQQLSWMADTSHNNSVAPTVEPLMQ